MRHVSLREFRTRGTKALGEVPAGETTLLVGQNGSAYFLVPVMGDVIQEDRELRLVMARASLRQGWRIARAVGALSDEEIEAEIAEVRTADSVENPGSGWSCWTPTCWFRQGSTLRAPLPRLRWIGFWRGRYSW